MANAFTGYNLDHVQIAIITATPTWVDLPYAQTLDPTISQDTEDLQADGKIAVTGTSAPVGEGSMEWARAEPVTLAILAGLTATSSGSTPATIDRLAYKGNSIPPGIHVAAWARNVDANVTGAGLRLILANAKATVPAITLGQETFSTLSADLKFNAFGASNEMLVLEFLEQAPVFTGLVMPATIAA